MMHYRLEAKSFTSLYTASAALTTHQMSRWLITGERPTPHYRSV